MAQVIELDLENAQIVLGCSEKVTRIAADLPTKWKDKLISCLIENHDIFAWLVQEVSRISPRVVEHRLNILHYAQPVI